MKRLPTALVFGLLSLFFVTGIALGSEEVLTLDNGDTIKVLFFAPDIEISKPRLALLISSSSSNTFMARAQFWLGKELVERGWAVAVPIAADGNGFGGNNSYVLPQLANKLRPLHGLSDQKPFLVGISSGGSTALTIASKFPDTFAGVVATPGRVQDDLPSGSLHGLPVYLRVGEKDDFRWNRRFDNIVSALQTAGAVVDAEIVSGARHVFKLDWDNLEIWLHKLP